MTTQQVDRYFPEWTIADRLRRVRRETGMTQEAFAVALGLRYARYSAWETGRNQPPAQDFIELAEQIEVEFGIDADFTLGRTSKNTPRPDGPRGVTNLRARRDSNPKPSDPKVLPLGAAA